MVREIANIALALGLIALTARREDFIAMKCFAGGPQDVVDAQLALKARSRPSIRVFLGG
jgi:hypothetical protein